MIVLDASVFVKVFHAEDGSDQARALLAAASTGALTIVAPDILKYEALGAALHYSVPFDKVLSLFESLEASGMLFVRPSDEELLLAETIATLKIAGGGYADLFDSVYHAMAIVRNGTFLTADSRHVAKAKQFGHVTLLADWRPG